MQWYKLVQARINKTGFGHLHINQRLVSFDQVEWMKCCAKNIELGYSIFARLPLVLFYYLCSSLMFSAQFHCHLVCKMESVDKVWVAAALSAKKKKSSLVFLFFVFFSFLQSIEEVDSKTKVNKFRTLKLRSLIRHHQNSCSLDLKNLQRSENENQTYANHYWCHCYYWERKKVL